MEGIMEYITSKDLCLLIRDILKLTDKRVMEHGSCVSYIVYRMLEETELFEEFEMAELSFITSLHNIGGYRTDNIEEMLKYGYKNYMPHSIYGYLFLKNLLPIPGYGKILLYHHMNYEQMSGVDYEFKFMSDYIHIADDAYTRYKESGGAFDYKSLKEKAGKKYSEKAYELLDAVAQNDSVFDRIDDGSYKEELDRLMDFVLFRDDEKQKYLEMLMYCTGLRSVQVMENTGMCVGVCDELSRRMGIKQVDRQRLYLAALLHDSGMLFVPGSIIRKPKKLSEKEMKVIQFHVKKADEVLREHFKDQEVVDIAVRHHERLDGSGYPVGLKAARLSRPERILQVADTVCGIAGKKSYHEARDKEETCRILREEAEKGRLDADIVKLMIENYTDIWKHIQKEAAKTLATYQKIEKQYEAAKQRFI